MSLSRILKTVIFMGSAKDISAPWGGNKRLGDGILNWVKNELSKRSQLYGNELVTHEFIVFDPLEVFSENGPLVTSGAEMRTPHFYFKPGTAPQKMDQMRDIIKNADCYLIISCEYNHTIPPALSSMMGHFGSSNYAYKPSGIITYSPGFCGGARVAMALRPFLSELGCLPVSKLACFSSVENTFNIDGTIKDTENRQLKQLPDLLNQLEWYTLACIKQKEFCGIPS